MPAAAAAFMVVRDGGLSADTERGRLERSMAARLVRLDAILNDVEQRPVTTTLNLS